MRLSSFRLLVVAIVLTVIAFVRPTAAQSTGPSTVQVDHFPDGVVGEGSPIFGGPDERTGAMAQTVPIELPPARGLAQPSLALRYDSNSVDREAGYGWGLDLPVIERRPLSGFPEFADDGTPVGEERYAFSGQPLVKICVVPGCPDEQGTEGHPTWADGWAYYRLQTDGAAIRFYRSEDRLTWRVLRQGGERLELGLLRGDTGASTLVPEAIERDLVKSQGIVRWQLAAQIDPAHAKNIVLYKWRRDGTGLSRHRLYLTDIFYTPPSGSVRELDDYAHHVELDWEDGGPRASRYTGPERARLSVRLKRIAVASKPWSSVTGAARAVVRAYHLRYLAARSEPYNAATMAPLHGHAFLREVQVQGRCDGAVEEDGSIPGLLSCPTLPAMRFGYEPGTMAFSSPLRSIVSGEREIPLSAPGREASILPFPDSAYVVDFNRDGLPDVVQGWEPSCNLPSDITTCRGCGGPIYEHGMKVAITPQGEPQLWCRTVYTKSEDCHTCGTTLSEYRVRSARPLLGYANGGTSTAAPLSFRYQCMDAGDGSTGTLPQINDGTTSHEHIRFLVPGGATILAGAGNALAFWQKDATWPIVARPLTHASSSLGGCFLDDRFDKTKFFPRWSWEAQVNATDFVQKSPAHKAVASDTTANEPSWFVDVDGDGLPDKLIEDTVHSPDLFKAKIAFSRYFAKGETLPPETSGGATTGGALVGFTPPRVATGAIVPARKVRFVSNEAEPLHAGVPTKFWYADVNGDGIQDFITSTEFDGTALIPRVRPGNGRGQFACVSGDQPHACTNGDPAPAYYSIDVISEAKPWVYAEITPPDSPPFQQRFFVPWHFVDVTGDGLADIVLQRGRFIYLWVNLDGQRFDCPGTHADDPCLVGKITLPDGEPSDQRHRLTFADMNADGVTDIVAIGERGVFPFFVYSQSPFRRAPRPGLLTRIDNGRGATTLVNYRTLQELDVTAASTNGPWTFHSPAQANVVTHVRVAETQHADSGIHLPAPFSIVREVDYQYRDPAYDRWKRKFVGFRSVVTNVVGEEAVTETTYWYGPCERDGVLPRALGGSAPSSGRCAEGSDDETGSTFLSRIGRPVRVDRYVPDRTGARGGPRFQWSRRLKYTAPITLFGRPSTDREVTASYPQEIETTFYDPAGPVVLGALETVAPDADEIRGSPTQGGARKIRQRLEWYAWTGELRSAIDDGETGVDPAVKSIRTTSCTRNWQCLVRNEQSQFDPDGSGQFATTASSARFEFDGNGELAEVWRDAGPRAALDRRNTDPGRGTAPIPPSSAGVARVLSLVRNADTGVVVQVRGPDAVAPQPCTVLDLDDGYHEHPRQIREFKGGCGSADPLVTELTFDRGFSVAVTSAAPDGGLSFVELDAFGRPENVFVPDPSAAGFTELASVIAYRDDAPLSYVDVKLMTSNFPTPRSVRRVTLLNALGEPAAAFTKDDGAEWVVDAWIERGAGGKVFRTKRPFSTTQDPIGLAASPMPIFNAADAPHFNRFRDGFGRIVRVTEDTTDIAVRTFGALSFETHDQEQLPGGSHVGAGKRFLLDGRGNVKLAVDFTTGLAGAIQTNVSYDGLSRPLRITKVSGSSAPYTRTMTWDMLGRLVANSEPNTSRDGHVWRYVYDDAGRLVGTSDARGCGKNVAYDGLGRLVAEDYSPCTGTQAIYTPEPEVSYTYDAYEAGQVSPEPGFADAPELAAGRLVAVRDRASHTRFNWDSRSHVRRLSRRIAKPPRFNPRTGDEYVDAWLAQRTDFDTAGRVITRTSGAVDPELLGAGGESSETYAYGTRGLTKRISSSYGPLVDDIAYAPDGQPTEIVYGDLARTRASFGYDFRRRPKTYGVSRSAPLNGLWTSSSANYPMPNPSTTQTALAQFTFQYDLVGNPTQIEDNADADQYADHAWPQQLRKVEYDDLYRVTKVTYGYGRGGGAGPFRSPYHPEVLSGDTRPLPLQSLATRVKHQTFNYDFLGNTTATNDDLSATYDRSIGTITNGSGVTAGPNQLVSANGVAAQYDEAGNVAELRIRRQGNCPSGNRSRCDQFLRYEWDEVGQLARARRWDFNSMPDVPKGAEPNGSAEWDLTYGYSLGMRVIKSAAERTGPERHTIDVFDTLRLDHVEYRNNTESYTPDPLAVRLSLGGGVGNVFYDPNLPYVASPVHRFINIGDHLGSAAITIDGETSELVERTTYQAFGALESDTRSPRWSDHREDWKFTGKEEDIEVGLTYFGARYYAPHLGRWASADPLTIHGLGADLNPYAYVGGRVMRDIDPFGLVTSCGDGCYDFSDDPGRISGHDRADEAAARAGPADGTIGANRGQGATAALANAVKPGWVAAAQTVVAASNGTLQRRPLGSAGDLASGFAKGALETHAVIALATGAEAPRGDSALYELGRNIPHLVPVVLGMAEAPPASSGAGGRWPVIGETPGGAVGQSTSTSCGAACGEMLTGTPQARIMSAAGAPTDAVALGRALGMRGGYVIPAHQGRLLAMGRPFIAELRSGPFVRLGHFVVVDAVQGGRVMIRDPWAGGSTYQMTLEAFQGAWTGNAVF